MQPSDIPSEGELIRRAQAGDQAAMQDIVRRHSESLLRCALTLSHDRQRAEDIAQETLLEAWRSIDRFDGRCRFSSWLFGILRHRYLKAMRHLSRRGHSDQPIFCEAELPPSLADPGRDSQHAEDAARVRRAVAALPEEHRQVIELRFFADASLEDIAAALDIPLGTVKSRLHNGLEKLRQQRISVNLFSPIGESLARQP